MSEFIWFKNYPENIPHTLGDPEFNSLIDLLDTSFKENSQKNAYVNFGKQITYKEVDVLSTRFAAYLQSLGLQKGDRIAIQMPNLLQYPIVLFGAIRAGLTVVNTNPLYTPREMEHQFKDSGVTAIIILANFAKQLEGIIQNTAIKHVIVTEIGDMIGGLKGLIMNFVVKSIKKMVPPYNLPDAIPFKKALSKGASMTYVKPDVMPDDILFLQYTGGTTGLSKGARLSHSNMIAHTAQIRCVFITILNEEEQDVMVTAIPLYHIFALAVNCILGIRCGMNNLLITNPRDMKAFLKDMSKQPFSIVTGVNTLFNGMMNHPDFLSLDFSRLKVTIAGGMALQDAVAKKWEELTKSPLVQGYGLSETSPVLTCNPLDGTHRIGTIGYPTPDTEVGIFDEEGIQLPQGETGEICARGPQVMDGYWNKENDQVFFPGKWFRTGDMGIMDEDGFFRIVDRKKDMILVSGFNVYPNEVENVVVDHPKVLEVAAIGVPHEKSGECVKLFVVKSDPSLTEEELHDYCEKNLTGYKRPKFIEFRDDLPKTNVGKILRRALKEQKA